MGETAVGFLGGICIRSAGMAPDAWVREGRDGGRWSVQLKQLRCSKEEERLRVRAAPMDGSAGCVVRYRYRYRNSLISV